VAILGASGSGKTVLLNALAGRNASGCRMSGKVKVNGLEVKAEQLRAISGYVPQQEIFIPYLTVSETVAFRV
jgi:ABC-type multidrug transport system ATPase subunit